MGLNKSGCFFGVIDSRGVVRSGGRGRAGCNCGGTRMTFPNGCGQRFSLAGAC